MAKLYYVDDQDLLVPTIRDQLKLNDNLWELYAFTQGNPVQTFMHAVESANRQPEDRYLLDIFMVPPKDLLTKNVWPEGYIGDQQFCGIALAKWLCSELSVSIDRIALYTHVNKPREHERAIKELFPNEELRYLRKGPLNEITQWLAQPVEDEKCQADEVPM